MRAYHLQSEAETLRAMLNAVRFTLVRRLGAGGMGVVYEAYDQQRGELVALKTMRRVDPAGAGPVQAGISVAQRYHPSQPGEPLRAVRGRRPLVLHDGAGRGVQLPQLCEGHSRLTPAARSNAEPTVIGDRPRSSTQSTPARKAAELPL